MAPGGRSPIDGIWLFFPSQELYQAKTGQKPWTVELADWWITLLMDFLKATALLSFWKVISFISEPLSFCRLVSLKISGCWVDETNFPRSHWNTSWEVRSEVDYTHTDHERIPNITLQSMVLMQRYMLVKGPFTPSVSVNSATMLRWRLQFCSHWKQWSCSRLILQPIFKQLHCFQYEQNHKHHRSVVAELTLTLGVNGP